MKNIKKVAIIIVVALIVQNIYGIQFFVVDVKASSRMSTSKEIITIEETTSEKKSEQPILEETTSEKTTEETNETPPLEETTAEAKSETPTTEETPPEETTEQPTTEEPTTVDYEIIDGLYKVKNNTLIEYVGDKKDKTITKLTIPAKVKTINKSVFEKCKYIESVKFASGSKLATIKKYAFRYCENLNNITLPSTLKTIEYRAFGSCTSLEKMNIPKSLTTARQILGTVSTVKKVNFTKGIKTIPEEILKNAVSVEQVTIPDGVTTVGKNAFCNCTVLKKIKLPHSVTTIKSYGFYNCSSMTGVTMSRNIKYIESHSFEKCEKLTTMTLYKTIVSIGAKAFYKDSNIVLKVYANSKGKAYARANNIKWEYTSSEKVRRENNTKVYKEYIAKISKADKDRYKLKYLTDYVPQGNCVIGDYLVVSMYHKYLYKRSILVLYNKKTGKFKKTLILPYYDHVGSVANVKGRLVVSLNNISVRDHVAVYNYKRLKKAKHGKVFKADYRLNLAGAGDFSAFDGTYFWAGKSANSNYATMQGYKVSVKKKKLVLKYKYSYYVPANTQGLIVKKIGRVKRRFIFSQSYGRINQSSLITYEKNINKSGGLGLQKKIQELPSMLEGICLGTSNYIYMVFESAAHLYCGNPDNTSEIKIKNVCKIKAGKLGY